jgi:Flp pilus assembly protein TadD
LQALGNAQLAAGEQGAAAASYRRSAGLQPKSVQAQIRLGRQLAGMGRSDDARAAYAEAVKLDPVNAAALRELVLADQREKGLSDALERAGSLAKRDQTLSDFLKGEAYFAASRFKEADEAYQAVLTRQPNSQVLIRQAQARIAAGNREESRQLLATWLQAHPDDQQVRFAYAEQLLANKAYPAAIREHELLIAKLPSNVVVLNNLAWLYQQSGNAKAVDFARKAHFLAPFDVRITDTLAWILVSAGQLDEAAALLAPAHARQPGNGEIAYHLAVAMERKGDVEKAVSLLKPAVDGEAFDQQADARSLLQKLSLHR